MIEREDSIVYPVRFDRATYAALEQLAHLQRRTRANMLRVLVVQEARRVGIGKVESEAVGMVIDSS